MIKQTLTAALVALSLGTAMAATTSSAFAWDDCEHNGYDRPSYSHNDDSYGNHYGYRRQGYNDGNQYGNRRRGYDGGYNNGY